MTADVRHGEVFLFAKGDRTREYRLRWEPGDDATRPLPAGTYVVTGYRHVAADDDGVEWIWSTTSPGYRDLTVQAGETTHLDVRNGLRVQTRAFVNKKDEHRVGLVFLAEKKLGHTLYRDGKRITITWQCLDADGEVLAEGPMQYG